MPQELNGYGPTAGDYMGGTGGNLNERPDNSTPGGGMQGNAGDNQGNDSSSAAPTMAYSSGIPADLFFRGGYFSFAIGLEKLSKLVSSPLAMLIGRIASRAYAPIALFFPTPIAPDDMSVTQMPQLYATQVMPAKEIVTADINTLPSLREAPVKARVSDVIESNRQVLAVVSDKGVQTKAPVVEARPTGKPQQFDVSVPGLSAPLRLDVLLPSAPQSKPNTEPDSKNFEKVVDPSVKSLYDGMLGGNTHDAIVTFPEILGMEPLYIAVTRILSEVELRQREENQAQAVLQQYQAVREQAEQTFNRMAVAGVDEITFYEQNKVTVEARIDEKLKQIAAMHARVVRLDAQARSARAFADLMQGWQNRQRLDANARAVAFEKEASEGRVQIEGFWREIGALNVQHTNVTATLAQKIEAKAKAEEEARAKLAALMALMTRAGVNPTPAYTSEMVKSAQTSLAAAGTLVLNRAPGMLQLATTADGTLTTASDLAGSISGALWRGATELSRIATTNMVESTVGALVVGFWPKEAGLGSDRVPGRDIEMFAAQAQLFAAGKVSIQPEMTSVNLPIRGFITVENGRQYANLVKTGVNGVSASVPVFRSVRDERTGLDKITLPAVGVFPARTILINPVPIGPAAPPHTGNSSPVPVTPVHTGTTVRQVDSIVTTPYPADDLKDIRDFIYWQPDAAGTGVEPIYVMLSSPVNARQQERFDELGKIFDKSNSSTDLKIEGKTIKQGPESNSYGTTKVYEGKELTDQQIHSYAQELAGKVNLVEVKSGIYKAKLADGTSITLRNISTSAEKTSSRWTIDIRDNPTIKQAGYKYSRVEVKFK